jgi:NAD(P)-dependent dehydrogenase (short-subunit alcohol dehydrogenase family)
MRWSPDRDALRGRVAVVAGATRGAGRGIAAALGEAGATVVCTGRSTRSRRSEYDRAETIEETAELVGHLGGTGIAVAADHLDPGQVQSLVARIRNDYGHIDVLVNDIWGAEVLKGGARQGCREPARGLPRTRERARWNQCSVSSGRLAIEYGFTDLDGSQPDIWRYLEPVGD